MCGPLCTVTLNTVPDVATGVSKVKVKVPDPLVIDRPVDPTPS